MNESKVESKRNFKAFIWHAAFLALASNFMDVDTIIPAMLIKVGGNAMQLGILTTIMIGGASFMQLFFSGMLSNQAFKKKFLIAAINLRVFSLLSLSALFYFADQLSPTLVFTSIFILITLFSFSGSFAQVSYIDILGKTISSDRRKHFFSLKQFITSVGLLTSAVAAGMVLKNYAFPINYGYLYLFAALLLFGASLGFYFLSENTPSTLKRNNIKSFFKLMPQEIRKNSNLRNYLIIINLLGIGVSLMPFVVLLAKERIGLSFSSIGTFLVFRTLGMLVGSLLLFFLAKRFKYNKVLLFNVFLGASIPLIALALQNHSHLFPLIFMFSGLFVSTFKIAMSGILVEISNNENRTLYAGMSGAGNILTTLFPLGAGFLIQTIGYDWVFVMISISMLSSFLFVRKLVCR